jgi:hypothetical protein
MAMDERSNATTRRGALWRLLGVAGGAVGLGALTRTDAVAAPLAVAARAGLTVYVPHLRQRKVGPDGAATYLPYGAVVDEHGRALGSLHTAALDSTGGSVTLQTFELRDGKIVGMGSNGAYVVVGGTGSYAALAGSYTDRSATRLPGRQFTFTFREGSNGS